MQRQPYYGDLASAFHQQARCNAHGGKLAHLPQGLTAMRFEQIRSILALQKRGAIIARSPV